jgi:hypothetical protein
MIRTITLIGLSMLLILLSGCGASLRGATASSSTPTIVPLRATTEAPNTPTRVPTASPIPSSSPTPTPAAPSPTPSSPPPTAAVATRSAASSQVAAPSAEEKGTTGKSLSGEWTFTFGTMSLTQRDARVEGSYQRYGGTDTGQIEGITVEDLNQFQGLWRSDYNPNSQGLLRWQLAADRGSFSGAFGHGDSGGQWCGVRSGQPLPSGCGFSGIWQLRFGSPPGLGQATLVQIGPSVSGSYVDADGHTGEIVDGVITAESLTEMKLTGVWRNDRGEQDSFEWRLDLTTDRTFQGRRDPGNSEWCGWRAGTDEPERCGWRD